MPFQNLLKTFERHWTNIEQGILSLFNLLSMTRDVFHVVSHLSSNAFFSAPFLQNLPAGNDSYTIGGSSRANCRGRRAEKNSTANGGDREDKSCIYLGPPQVLIAYYMIYIAPLRRRRFRRSRD